MSLRFSRRERTQARAYRAMVRRVRTRAKAAAPARPAPAKARQIDKAHKAAISRLFCVATALRHGVERYGVHVAHLRFSRASAGARNPGLQRKPDDRWTLPLCPEEHRLQHSMGEAAYWAELQLDPHALATAIWRASPDHAAMIFILQRLTKPLSPVPSN